MLGRLRLFLRRHLATAQLLDDLGPSIVFVGQRGGRLERLEVQPVLLFLVSVAGNAVFGDERANERVEAFDGFLRRDSFGGRIVPPAHRDAGAGSGATSGIAACCARWAEPAMASAKNRMKATKNARTHPPRQGAKA